MKRHQVAVGALVIALAVGATGAAITAAQQSSQREEQVSSADIRPLQATPLPARAPGETFEQYRQRVPQAAASGGRPYNIAQETRGVAIIVAGKTVQLPPDAYVEAIVTGVTCGSARSCAETPGYVIGRGHSRIGVAMDSGRILSETTAPGEESFFTFLKEALR